ncbi:MAG TPA: DinB family protein [Phycisphaerales bacterium]|nr:DinB family protein [Phycisphaerales bacterium]
MPPTPPTPRTSDPLSALLAHNVWATRLILEKCRSLTDEQFRRPFPIGPADHGGLHAILTHIVGAMRRWADRIAQRPLRAPLEHWRPGYQPRAPYTPDELLALLEDAHTDLTQVIANVLAHGEPALARELILHFSTPTTPSSPIASPSSPTAHSPLPIASTSSSCPDARCPMPDASSSFTSGVCIASAAVHGHYHRAQCMNILRQLNVPGVSDRLPSLDVVDWQQATE